MVPFYSPSSKGPEADVTLLDAIALLTLGWVLISFVVMFVLFLVACVKGASARRGDTKRLAQDLVVALPIVR